MIIASFLMSASAFAATYAGDKIEFQADSAFVSAVFSKSLCLDGDTYKAVITKCTQWKNQHGESTCVASAKVAASQPAASTREICTARDGREGNCTAWATVPYVQSPVKNVQVYSANDGNLIKEFTVTVPSCN